ncbi:MAG: hypothetical protein KVP17_000684 [Porospora cf. gigantea B]|uniref:uncharacterized protein n=1 Tax=Porospora cf. gigantea B TaxID=2853592 RepID=UPI00357192D8|nr:MAG: hypothetical protein KVP17_000684 [Porospora cf. gigantea B]
MWCLACALAVHGLAGLMGSPTDSVGDSVEVFRAMAADCLDSSRCFDNCGKHFTHGAEGLRSLARVVGFPNPHDIVTPSMLCRHLPVNTAFLVVTSGSLRSVGVLEGFQLALVSSRWRPPSSEKFGIIFSQNDGQISRIVDVQPRPWAPRVLKSHGLSGVLDDVMLPVWAGLQTVSPFLGRLANATATERVLGVMRADSVDILDVFTPVAWSVSSLNALLKNALKSPALDMWVILPLLASLCSLIVALLKGAPDETDPYTNRTLSGLLDAPVDSPRKRFNTEWPSAPWWALEDSTSPREVHSSPFQNVADF